MDFPLSLPAACKMSIKIIESIVLTKNSLVLRSILWIKLYIVEVFINDNFCAVFTHLDKVSNVSGLRFWEETPYICPEDFQSFKKMKHHPTIEKTPKLQISAIRNRVHISARYLHAHICTKVARYAYSQHRYSFDIFVKLSKGFRNSIENFGFFFESLWVLTNFSKVLQKF